MLGNVKLTFNSELFSLSLLSLKLDNAFCGRKISRCESDETRDLRDGIRDDSNVSNVGTARAKDSMRRNDDEFRREP